MASKFSRQLFRKWFLGKHLQCIATVSPRLYKFNSNQIYRYRDLSKYGTERVSNALIPKKCPWMTQFRLTGSAVALAAVAFCFGEDDNRKMSSLVCYLCVLVIFKTRKENR